MTSAFLYLALAVGQQITLQSKPVVHLQPNHASIDYTFAGKLVELLNAPSVIEMPSLPPRVSSDGTPWAVDVKNVGPGTVKIHGKGGFSVTLGAGEAVHISSSGSSYSFTR